MEASFGDGVSFYFCFSSGGEKSCILGLLIRSHEKKNPVAFYFRYRADFLQSITNSDNRRMLFFLISCKLGISCKGN
jgi:hypothetical protein